MLFCGLFFFCFSFFFFNDTATSEIYTLSLHDALPILDRQAGARRVGVDAHHLRARRRCLQQKIPRRSEEHTSELQSRGHLVCRLLLEKKKKIEKHQTSITPTQLTHNTTAHAPLPPTAI